MAALGGLLLEGKRVLEAQYQAGELAERSVWQGKQQAADAVKLDVEHSLQADMDTRLDTLTGTLTRFASAGAQINVRLPQALAASPRYQDPNCALTPDVLNQLNAARALSR